MKKICTVYILFLICFSLFAYPVTDIEFVGLKRTKSSYIQSVVSRFLNTDSNNLDLNEVETVLKQQNLFSQIRMELSENKSAKTAKLTINVKEKISFIPMPFLMYANKGFSGGAVLMDQNAFGMKNTFMVGGIFSKDDAVVMAGFSKASVDASNAGFSFFGSYGKQKISIRTLNNKAKDLVSCQKLNFNFSVNTKPIPGLYVNFATNYTGYFKQQFEYMYGITRPLNDANQVVFSPSARYSKADWNGVFLNESYAEVNCDFGWATGDEIVLGAMVRGVYQKAIIPKLRWSVAIGASVEKNKYLLNQRTRQVFSNAIIPAAFYSDKIAAASLNLEGAVYKSEIFTLSLYGSYQGIAVKDYDGCGVFMHGIGGGARVYLEKISFPACSAGWYYNFSKDISQFAISMGMSF